MFTQLRIKNFKSWANTGDLRIAPLTGFFGANSSGKTSLLQVLLMLKQTAESPDRRQVLFTGDKNSLVDLGTFYDLIHNHQLDIPLEFSFSWNLAEELKIPNPETQNEILYNIESLSFTTAIREAGGTPAVERFAYQFDGHLFGMSPKRNQKGKYELETGDYRAKRVPGRVWPLPSPVKCYGFPDEAFGYYQNTGFLADFVLAFEQMFSRVVYLGPLREYPQRSYIWAGETPSDVGRKGEDAVAALLAAQSEKRKFYYQGRKRRLSKPIAERISEWLKLMGLIHSFELKPIAENRKDYELRIKKTPLSSEVLITDVGFGVSQLLPILVLCYYVPEHSTIILEQPEIHLHPSVQATLADVLIEVVRERNVQIIFESHSEHLLRRLQRRVAEEELSPDQTALYFCSMGEESSHIEPLDIDIFGSIRNWPKDFFGDEIGDLVAKTEAAMMRQGAGKL